MRCIEQALPDETMRKLFFHGEVYSHRGVEESVYDILWCHWNNGKSALSILFMIAFPMYFKSQPEPVDRDNEKAITRQWLQS